MPYTKQVHFTFNDEIYIQSDGFAISSSFGYLLANIFMSILEEEVLPTISFCLCN